MSIPAIQKIFAQYCQYIDAGRLEELSNLFADDGVLVMEPYGIKEKGRQAIRARYGMMADPKLKGAHATFNHIIDIIGQGDGATASATADATYIDVSKDQPRLMVLARYRANFASVHGEWKIKEWNIEVKASAFAG